MASNTSKGASKPRPQRFCIFCGNAGLTREHIWADWLKKYIPKTAPRHSAMRAVMDKGVSHRTVKIRPGDPQSRRIKIVCGRCNHGWMSKLQESTKPILLPLLNGRACVLSQRQQKILAAWAAMTVMCAEFLEGPHSAAVAQSDRKFVMDSQTAPKDWKIWIGHYARGNWKGYWLHHSLCISDEPPEMTDEGIPIPNTQTTTFVVGALYIHALSSVHADIVARIVPTGRIARCLAPLWPFRESLIAWPPHALTDADADKVAGEIFLEFDRIGRAFGS